MIPIETAELAVAIARGLIKLGGRLDRLLAEKVATLGGLTLKPPPVEFSIGPNRMVDELQKLINAAVGINRDPLGQRRKVLVELLKSAEPDPDELREFYALLFPGGALALKIGPDEEYLKFLRSALPSSSLDDADARTAAFYVAAFSIDPGSDNRQLGYPMRTGLLVADVLAEFGAEQTQLFVRDEGLRTVVQAVLSRFAQPELESFDQWSPLLRHTLSATLNGALEAKAALNGSNPWLGAVLDALIEARDAAGEDGDNYLLGLLQGKGYQVLISQGLAKAAQVLAATDADTFQQIAADVLKQALPLVAADSKDFGGFFTEHWADLLHAALQSLDKHGPALLQGQEPLLKEVLLASIHTLAETPGTRLLTRDTIFPLTDAIVGAVATHPDLVKAGLDENWLAEVINSVVKTASDQGIRTTFSKEGLAGILRGATATLAEHPELIVAQPGIFQNVVGAILARFSTLDALDAKTVASAAVQETLGALAAHPNLLKTTYADAIADFAGLLAAKVSEKSLSAFQASEMISAAATAAWRHPELYADVNKGVAGIILNAGLRAAKDNPAGLLDGEVLVALVQELLVVFARRGRDKIEQLAGRLEDELVKVLQAGVAQAEKELGHLLDRSTLAPTLAALVTLWLRNQLPVLDAKNSAFQKLFAKVAENAAA